MSAQKYFQASIYLQTRHAQRNNRYTQSMVQEIKMQPTSERRGNTKPLLSVELKCW
eukprot:m.718481 g.718481  ORF g.718481 m.718481 type:complete len:56 (+) comp22995_c0_seq2:4095-4262(+)